MSVTALLCCASQEKDNRLIDLLRSLCSCDKVPNAINQNAIVSMLFSRNRDELVMPMRLSTSGALQVCIPVAAHVYRCESAAVRDV
jgi:hypothetical protein